MFADDGEAPAAPCRTASLLGDGAEERCVAFDGGGGGGDGRDGGRDGEKKKLGRPKGSPNKRVGSPSSEPSVSTSATGSRAKKAKTSKGFCICRGCNKKFDSDAVSTSTDFDNDCKRSLDRLRHIAENEGPDAYAAFKTAFADTPKLQKMLKAYWAKVGGVPKKGVRSKSGAPKFSVTQYTESMKASSGIEWRGRGRMMWEKHWLEYAQTVEGGKHTEEQAQTKWNEWKRQKDADPRSIIWDLAGPRKENPLQFRIDLAASVDFLGTYIGTYILGCQLARQGPEERDQGGHHEDARRGLEQQRVHHRRQRGGELQRHGEEDGRRRRRPCRRWRQHNGLRRRHDEDRRLQELLARPG